jgi:hypothetical protein
MRQLALAEAGIELWEMRVFGVTIRWHCTVQDI